VLTAAGIAALVSMAMRLGGDAVDFAGVAASESGLQCWAHNPRSHTAGLFQFEPDTIRQLGYDVTSDPHLDNFCRLSDVEQLAWFEKYFANHRGHLTSEAAVYVATFLPADTNAAGDPQHVLCSLTYRKWAYDGNRGFDRTGKGAIIVQDLVDAIERAKARTPGWADLVAKIRTVQAQLSPPVSPLADTDPPCPGSDGAA